MRKPNVVTLDEASAILGRAVINFVSVHEIAKLAGVNVKTAYEWVKWGSFPVPPINVSRTRRWRLSEILFWLATYGQEGQWR